MDFKVFSLVKTRTDIDNMQQYIDILLDSLYRTGKSDYKHTLETILPLDTARMLDNLSSDKEILKGQLNDLKKTLHEARIIKLTLAFEPSIAVAEKISASLRKILNFDVVLDLIYDKNILGGVVIEYQGKYVDKSVKSKLELMGL